MRIHNNLPNLTQALAQTAPADSPTTGKLRGGRRTARSGDRVQLSDMAALLSVDPSKLAQLQSEVSSGTYNVSPSQIANSIINASLT